MNTISLETVRGYIEDGEDPKDAAIREAHEELGIDEDSIININQLGKVNPENSYTNQAVYCFSMQLDYKGSIDEEKLQKEEGILSVKWYPREDIPGMILDLMVKLMTELLYPPSHSSSRVFLITADGVNKP